jgi:hypothetical protein
MSRPEKVIGECCRRHRSIEFRKLLERVDAAVPNSVDVHLVLDNYGRTKCLRFAAGWCNTPLPRALHVYQASWINTVDRRFATLTERQLRRRWGGVHRANQEFVQFLGEAAVALRRMITRAASEWRFSFGV